MERKVELKQVTKEYITYVASDGTEFMTEAECKKYEETAEHAIRKAVCDITAKTACASGIFDEAVYFSFDGELRAIPIRNVNDLEIANRWILTGATNKDGTNCISANRIGDTMVFEEYDGYIYSWGTIDEMVDLYRKTLIKHLVPNAGENEGGKS